MSVALRNVVSGFVLTGLQAVMSLLVVRGYVLNLEKSTYGVCMAVAQVTALMAFLDLGIGAALARYVVDFRRTMSDEEFGGMLKTLLWVGLVQCMVCLALMGAGAGHIADILRISDANRSLFIRMVWLVAVPTSLCFMLRPFGQLLYSTGRLYAVNLISLLSTTGQSLVVLFGLYHGWGPYSVVAGQWVSVVCMQTALMVLVVRSSLVPSLRVAAVPLSRIRPLFAFSRDVFCVAIGRQLLQFGPTLLISRVFGEARLGDWHAGTRVLGMVSQFISRVPAGMEPLLWRMFAEGEHEKIRRSLTETIRVTIAVCCLGGAGLVMANSAFVHAWTSGRVVWSPDLDVLCLLWMLVVSMELSGGTLLGITKRVGLAPVVYYAEFAVIFLLSSAQAFRSWGFGAAILALAMAHACFTLLYNTMRMKRDLDFRWREIAAIYGPPTASIIVLAAASWTVASWVQGMSLARASCVIACVYSAIVVPGVWFGLVPVRHRQNIADVTKRFVGEVTCRLFRTGSSSL